VANKNNEHKPNSVGFRSWKPGSDPAHAKDVGGEGDFGVPVGDGPTPERKYVTTNTKLSDPGRAKPLASEEPDGRRDHGVGARVRGPASGSGGDIDTDIIGVGTHGAGISASGPGDAPGPDDSDGSSDEFASPPHARGSHQSGAHEVGGSKRIPGSTISHDADVSTSHDGQGADAATNPARGDDSFAGEISSGEARGEDGG